MFSLLPLSKLYQRSLTKHCLKLQLTPSGCIQVLFWAATCNLTKREGRIPRDVRNWTTMTFVIAHNDFYDGSLRLLGWIIMTLGLAHNDWLIG